ncbi:hypothetical protein THOM_0100, partial [Trachipleistophora hominis]
VLCWPSMLSKAAKKLGVILFTLFICIVGVCIIIYCLNGRSTGNRNENTADGAHKGSAWKASKDGQNDTSGMSNTGFAAKRNANRNDKQSKVNNKLEGGRPQNAGFLGYVAKTSMAFYHTISAAISNFFSYIGSFWSR